MILLARSKSNLPAGALFYLRRGIEISLLLEEDLSADDCPFLGVRRESARLRYGEVASASGGRKSEFQPPEQPNRVFAEPQMSPPTRSGAVIDAFKRAKTLELVRRTR
jgi:hypothetical protein